VNRPESKVSPSQGLVDGLFGLPAMNAIFSPSAQLQAMLDFEASLARAEADSGVIPNEAVAAIVAACRAEHFDIARLSAAATRAGNPAIPLIEQLTSRVSRDAEFASRYVHVGATSQDVIDSALVLQMRSGLSLLLGELERALAALERLVVQHRDTVMVGRTWLQHAVPITFGLKAAGWLSALCRDHARLRGLQSRVLCLQFGGAAGTLGSLGVRGMAVAEALAGELGLTLPALPWHTQRDRVTETGTVLGLLIASYGKLARDISLLMQNEISEVCEPSAQDRGGSSSMPQKRNPVGCAIALAAAVRAPGLVSTLLSAAVQEHERGLGGWHAEWEPLPELFRCAAAASHALADVLEGLHVDTARMRANLERSAGQAFAEQVALALAEHLGKAAAHALVRTLSQQAQQAGRHLREELGASAEVRAHLDEAALDALFDPAQALGSARNFVDRALAEAAQRDPGG
jgi:3-carboxy-cis,cis-muconate cycloisomerase